MKFLIFTDVHANLHALRAVLEHADGAYEAAICLGDVVGYGAFPNECCDLVRDLVQSKRWSVCLMGNHDAAAVGALSAEGFNSRAKQGVIWSERQLTPANSGWLRSLDAMRLVEVNRDCKLFAHVPRFEIVHGSLRRPLEEYIYDSEEVQATFARMATPWCFHGHTHLAGAWCDDRWGPQPATAFHRVDALGDTVMVERDDDERILLNPGSVGQPRDRNPLARYAIFDSFMSAVEVRAVEYDVKAAAAAIYKAGLPRRFGDRLAEGV